MIGVFNILQLKCIRLHVAGPHIFHVHPRPLSMSLTMCLSQTWTERIQCGSVFNAQHNVHITTFQAPRSCHLYYVILTVSTVQFNLKSSCFWALLVQCTFSMVTCTCSTGRSTYAKQVILLYYIIMRMVQPPLVHRYKYYQNGAVSAWATQHVWLQVHYQHR